LFNIIKSYLKLLNISYVIVTCFSFLLLILLIMLVVNKYIILLIYFYVQQCLFFKQTNSLCSTLITTSNVSYIIPSINILQTTIFFILFTKIFQSVQF